MKNKYLIIVLIQLNFIYSQNSPCHSLEHNQFDFWVGEWEVFDKNNEKIGTNNVIKQYDNCLIQENWISLKSKNRGTSYNYFDTQDNNWKQLWIDNQGFILKLKGNFIDSTMVLKSELVNLKNKKPYYNKISWTKNKDGSVTQVWEIFDKKNNKINTLFKGIYKKKN